MKKSAIWMANLPEGMGHEQKGFRPAVVLGSANGLVAVVPLTSNTNKATFAYTSVMEATNENGLSADSVALVFQIKTLDKARFQRKLGVATKEQMDAIDEMITELFDLHNK